MSTIRDIKPMPAAEIVKLKDAIERRWNEKPWYQGGDDPMSSPGCMMRAQEILALIAAAEAGSPGVASNALTRIERLERTQRNAATLLKLMAESPSDRHELTYTNYRGETSRRQLHLVKIWWGSTEWHPEPQLLLSAFDWEKDAYRDFAVGDFSFEEDGGTDHTAGG
jgi:hypothetical protein